MNPFLLPIFVWFELGTKSSAHDANVLQCFALLYFFLFINHKVSIIKVKHMSYLVRVAERQRHSGGAAGCCMQPAHLLGINCRVDVGGPPVTAPALVASFWLVVLVTAKFKSATGIGLSCCRH